MQVLQLYSVKLAAVETLEDPESPKYCAKEGFFVALCEMKAGEVAV